MKIWRRRKVTEKDFTKGTIVQVKDYKGCDKMVIGEYAVVVRHNSYAKEYISVDFYTKCFNYGGQYHYKNLRIVA